MKTCTNKITRTLPVFAAALIGLATAATWADGKGDEGGKGDAAPDAPKTDHRLMQSKTDDGSGKQFPTGHSSSTQGGLATANPCELTNITQNTEPNTVEVGGSITCGSAAGSVENRYARAYGAIASDTLVECVKFAVQSNDGGVHSVRVRMYHDPSGANPNVGTLVLLSDGAGPAEVFVDIPTGTNLTTFVGSFREFPGRPNGFTVPAGTNLVVEVRGADRSCGACDGGQIFIGGSDDPNQLGPTYWMSDPCGFTEFTDVDTIAGFEGTAHMQVLNACTTLTSCSCVADTDGDNDVDIDDFTAVSLQWNNKGPVQPTADVAPATVGQPQGNCVVNIDDYTAIVLGWTASLPGGVCAPPTGRCCTPAGGCSETSEAACIFPNRWEGACSTCAIDDCDAFPLNDECEGASLVGALSNGTSTISNGDGTAGGAADGTTSPLNGAFCAAGNGVPNDIWLNYVATCNGRVRIRTFDATGGTNVDTLITANEGDCDDFDPNSPTVLTEVGCDDDSGDALLSDMTFTVASGTTYHIRMGCYLDANSPEAYNSWRTIVTCTPFNDDLCSDATAVGALPATVVGNFFGATTGDEGGACVIAAASGAGRWYTAVGTGNTQTASLCGTSTAFPGVLNTRLHAYCNDGNIFDDDDCSNLQCVTGNDTAVPVCGAHARATFPTNSGQLYRMLVSSSVATFTTTRNFQLIVTDNGIAATGQAVCAPPVPANDLCTGAIALSTSLPVTVAGTTLGSSPPVHNGDPGGADPDLPATSPSCQWSDDPTDAHNTVWYTFTPVVTDEYQIGVCATPGASLFGDSNVSIYTGACGSLTEFNCDDDGCACAAPWYSLLTGLSECPSTDPDPLMTLTSGTTYRICVAGAGGATDNSPGDFNITAALAP